MSDTNKKEISNLKEIFADSLLEVNNTIAESIFSKETLVENIGSYLFHAGGKRLRPILTLLFSKICGYEGKNHIFLAASVELIHAATLLHDDVVDESSTRRNNPTANFKWGNKASILVGDFLFSQSFKLMVKSGSMEALKCLSDASSVIAEGEVMQLSHLYKNNILSIAEYEAIARSKTAALFGASAEVGAIISNQNSLIKNTCREYGSILGLIFQVTDDMLDYFSNSAITGKNLGDDLAQGNITLPVIIAYNNADNHDQEIIRNIFFDSNNRAERFNDILAVLMKYHIEEKINDYIADYHNKALDCIKLLPGSDLLKEYLLELLNYAILRKN